MEGMHKIKFLIALHPVKDGGWLTDHQAVPTNMGHGQIHGKTFNTTLEQSPGPERRGPPRFLQTGPGVPGKCPERAGWLKDRP